MIISNQRIRLAVDESQMGTINDVITGATPQFWNGVDLQFELGVFYGAALAAVSNFDSITVDLKQGDPRTGLPLMSKTVASGALNNALTLDAWNGGATVDCHALIVFTNAESNLDLSGDSDTFWLVISALTNDSPAHVIVLGATPLTVVEGGEGVTPPAPVVTPIYYTAAQSDTRYSRTVDLTTINTHLSTLDSEMTAVTSTATAAMPKTGGTFSGGVTITGLSGILKAVVGVLTGSATTSDLPEGTNLYWTSGRFTSAIAAIAGAASGVCPLDSSSLIPASYLPAITVHNTFVVASQSAMLALAAHQGDVAIRTDINESFILTNNTPSVLGNWSQLLTPTSSVVSVNGLSGAVTLTTTNINEGTNLYYTTARAKVDAIAAALTGFTAVTGGNVTSGDTVVIALGRLEKRVALNDAKLTGSDRVLKAGDTMAGPLQFSGSTNAGVVLSNLTDTQRAALTPANGMVIYNTTLAQVMVYNGAWLPLATGGGTIWFSGAGVPSSGLGANGNYNLDTATGNIYLKSAGAWAIIYSPSAGSGSAIKATIQLTAQTSAISATTFFTTPNDGVKHVYRVSLAAVTTAGGTGTSAGFAILFTAAGVGNNVSAGSLSLTSTGNCSNASPLTVQCDANTALQYSVSGAGGTGVYSLNLVLEQLI